MFGRVEYLVAGKREMGQSVHVPGLDRKRPWSAPARSLILYCPEKVWRFAVYNEAGIIDGRMADLPEQCSPEDAQAALVADVEDWTGLKYCVTWSSDKPGWWTADLQRLDGQRAPMGDGL
jgi:hypothetical protein